MENDFTIVSFIKPESDGPIFGWDPSGVWGDHLWIVKGTNAEYSLFFRPMAMDNVIGKAITIGKLQNFLPKDFKSNLQAFCILYQFIRKAC